MHALAHAPASILVLRGGAVGDFILTIPVVDTLLAAWPDARVLVAGRPDRVALIEDRIAGALDIDDAGWAPLFAPGGTARGAAADAIATADLVVNFIPDPDGHLHANLERHSAGRVISHSPHPPDDGSRHVTDHLLSALAPLGIPLVDRPRVLVDPAPTDDPPFVLHPGSGGAHKVWPADRFAAVARALAEHGPVVVTRGPADPEPTALASAGARIHPPVGLRDLAALYAGVRLFVGNDSGPAHLAAAVGCPTIAVFGPTDPRIWAPRGSRVAVVAGSPDLPPESRLESVTTEAVLESANRLISLKI